jgi:hypothetical protein
MSNSEQTKPITSADEALQSAAGKDRVRARLDDPETAPSCASFRAKPSASQPRKARRSLEPRVRSPGFNGAAASQPRKLRQFWAYLLFRRREKKTLLQMLSEYWRGSARNASRK